MFGWFKKKLRKRSFDAAKHTRLLNSWESVQRSINQDLKTDLDSLRSRSRDLVKNDPMAKRYVSLVPANVVGSRGFVLQSKVKNGTGEKEKLDKPANSAIEKAFAEWSKVGSYEITGRLSRADGERLVMRTVPQDGECLIRERKNIDSNKFGYALEFLDVARLATNLSREAEGSKNAIIMGVEIDSFSVAVNYHLHKNLNKTLPGDEKLIIPADELIHLFLPESPEQLRGAPWMHASMTRMFHLKKYQEWAIIAAGVGASKMGFFTTPDGDGAPLADGEVEETGELYQEAAAGQFGVLPEGVEFTPFNPDYPHQMYAEFIKTAKRDIASGMNVSYHSLANDLEGVNFSSIRAGTLEDREQWMVIQNWFIACFLERVYNNWLTYALLKGAIVQDGNKKLPASKREKFMAHEFLGRRWPWVDPLKDTNANIAALGAGLAMPSNILAQQGLDQDEVLDDISRFQQAAKEKGVILSSTIDLKKEVEVID
tara:strand:+ start:4308 stop:5762 length:1455 start_codon:yes stop_codon:yes gene_type:complete